MAWWRFPTAKAAAIRSGRTPSNCSARWRACLAHPNVSAALILGLGCEVNQIDHYLGPNAPRASRLVGMTLQGSGGTRGTVEAARNEIARLMEHAPPKKRAEAPASKIVLGLNCGGSDSFSGITANPALGVCSRHAGGDRRNARCWPRPPRFSAPSICWCGAPATAQVAERLLSFVQGYKKYLTQLRGQLSTTIHRRATKKAA